MSEYTSRYQHASHEALYDGVHAGQPAQIDGLAAQWTATKDIVDGLAQELGADLNKLANSWTGTASAEFQARVGLVADYSRALSDGMADVQRALSLMADSLTKAQQVAESPEATDDHDKTISGAVKGGLVFGVAGAAIGGLMGHQQDKEEQERARQRMVQVVANLAASYDTSAFGRMLPPPPPHPEMPGNLVRSDAGSASVGGVGSVSGGPRLGSGSGAKRSAGTSPSGSVSKLSATGGAGDGAGAGSGGTATPGVIGSRVDPLDPAGAVGAVGGVPTGTSLAGAQPTDGSGLLAGGPPAGAGSTGGGGGSSSGLLLGAGATAVGGAVGTGALASSGRAAATGAIRSGAGGVGADNRSAAGTGRLASGRTAGGAPGEANRSGAAGGNRSGMAGGSRSGSTRPGVLGGRGQHDEHESDERLTWLTEDEMVWQDGDGGTPPVLGTER
ncbi:WXG100 family type VII secretion target [Micromonospora sp. PLK6-60]|uniref:WXG100 family type VII secretion target n=1 Tax=Micromonospora sp. PLK6-60 TaxID=2873383 RepID=UPI001CA690CC|nr:WXG100 family type VII secretion target [Micromonospora sp. PLK6-60]MBY8871730.1 WXG100 family type VII secretion target [Micromonospora sp. PLK6-60]